MDIKKQNKSDTEVKLTLSVNETYLKPFKDQVLLRIGREVKLPGFRANKAPLHLVEKHIDSGRLQSEVLESAIEAMYAEAIAQEKLRPVAHPTVNLKKFVPYNLLEIEIDVEVVGDIKLPDYKNMKLSEITAVVSPEEVDKVIDSLKLRMAEKKTVKRAAGSGDEVWIDFNGVDDKGQPVKGADGKDYPLVIGSNTFIPGFEENLTGTKAGENKTFTLTFPKDYQLKALASKKVTFKVVVNKVQAVNMPKVDDVFASKVGPFKTVAELKKDIHKELLHQRQHEVKKDFQGQVVRQVQDKTKMIVPPSLIEIEIDRLLRDLKQNLTYRGQTYSEFLEAEGFSEDDYRAKVLIPQATERVKGSLVLAEVALKEELSVTPDEIDHYLATLNAQHSNDPLMLDQLKKPETRQEMASRLLTKKTLSRLADYFTTNNNQGHK